MSSFFNFLFPRRRPDESSVPEALRVKFCAVKKMLEIMDADSNSFFMVTVGRYYIRGVPAVASGLALSPVDRPNIVLRAEGFDCDAIFPLEGLRPGLYDPSAVTDGKARVRVNVDLCDVWGVECRYHNGTQCREILYQDLEGYLAQKKELHREAGFQSVEIRFSDNAPE